MVDDNQKNDSTESSSEENTQPKGRALSKKTKLIAGGGVGAAALGAIYMMFSGGETKPKIETQTVNIQEERPMEEAQTIDQNLSFVPETKTPPLPPMPVQEIELVPEEIPEFKPLLPPPPPPPKIEIQLPKPPEQSFLLQPSPPTILVPPTIVQPNSVILPPTVDPMPGTATVKVENTQVTQRRRNAGFFIGSSSGSGEHGTPNCYEPGCVGKKCTPKTTAAQITEGCVGQKNRMLLTGKLIELVLESGIDTAIKEGILRGTVSTDVYSEAGSNILIPAGSRVIGKYKDEQKQGNKRIQISFDRVIRPDNIDIMLGGTMAVDSQGRAGIEADRSKSGVLSVMANSVMIGVLSMATLFGSKEIERISDIRRVKSGLNARSAGNLDKAFQELRFGYGYDERKIIDALKSFEATSSDPMYIPYKATLDKFKVKAVDLLAYTENYLRVVSSGLAGGIISSITGVTGGSAAAAGAAAGSLSSGGASNFMVTEKDLDMANLTKSTINNTVEPLRNYIDKASADIKPQLVLYNGAKIMIMLEKDIVFRSENAYSYHPYEQEDDSSGGYPNSGCGW